MSHTTGLPFDINLAVELAEFCRWASHSRVVSLMILQDKGYKVDYFDSSRTSTGGFVASNNQHVVVVFEATRGLRDWFTDISAWYNFKHRFGPIHSGFMKAYSSVGRDIVDLLAEHQTKDKKLYVTGHSLGGALATIAATDIAPDQVYTYGSPRVMGVRAAKEYDQWACPTHRVAISGDLVTRLPKPLFYRHVGKLYYFSVEGKHIEDPTRWERFKHATKDLLEEFLTGTLFDGEDHSLALYEGFLRKKRGRV